MRKFIKLVLVGFSLLFIWLCDSSFAGSKHIYCNSDSLVSQKEIYDILNFIITDKKLDKSFQLNRNVLLKLSRHKSDKEFLKSLIIDSTRKFYKDLIDDSGKVSRTYFEPNLNILELKDVKQMKSQKNIFRSLEWDNSKLGFIGSQKNSSYSFSIPYFSVDKKIVIVRYLYFCGELCAGGQTLVLRKINGFWEIDWIESWLS